VRRIDGLRGCHPQAVAHTLVCMRSPYVCIRTLSCEALGQVFPIGELGVVHVQGIGIHVGLENERLIEWLVHVCIHTFVCWQDEIVSEHDDSYDVCIHTFDVLDGLGHGEAMMCVYTHIQD
jgi:hypothetical protein